MFTNFKPTLFGERRPDGRLNITTRWRKGKKLPSLGIKPWILTPQQFHDLDTTWKKQFPPDILDKELPEPFDFAVPNTGPYAQLYPHQRKGVARMLQLGGKVLLADEMGLGKTRTSAAFAACVQRHLGYKVAVVAPSYLKPTWAREISPFCDATVISYSMITRASAQEKRAFQGILILDEAQ
jgi:SNF2 family DNA or RNA helicase